LFEEKGGRSADGPTRRRIQGGTHAAAVGIEALAGDEVEFVADTAQVFSRAELKGK